jgi:hypothetical protein
VLIWINDTTTERWVEKDQLRFVALAVSQRESVLRRQTWWRSFSMLVKTFSK